MFMDRASSSYKNMASIEPAKAFVKPSLSAARRRKVVKELVERNLRLTAEAIQSRPITR
jgi:hypothetical protein